MVLAIIRVDAIDRQDYSSIALISIDRSHPNTSMSIDPGQDQCLRIHSIEHRVKRCAEESAIAFLDQNDIRSRDCEFGDEFASRRSANRYPNTFCSHFWKSIGEVRIEFLTNPHNRLARIAHHLN